ncbi:MAG TPA: serine/threonine-protein kinase [Candidatus Binatia bacterium]|nr:serine/threonine-protein kinase [Candidatus Binatia bacterium]
MKICRVCQNNFPDDVGVCPNDGTDLHSSTEIKEGTVIRGKYEIISKLGEGGMGAVFKVRHKMFGEILALKVVAERLLQEPGFLQRFRSEALIMRALNHPNDVRVQDYDETEDGRPFTVMEYVEGTRMDQLIPAGSQMDMVRAVRLVMQVCDGLGAAHQLGIIHRDVKPYNIMVCKDAQGNEVAKILDYGVAKVKEQGQLYQAQKTQAGVMIGTPAYMSPEQVKGIPSDQLDGRVDLYAAGIILYELLCGRGPFVEKKPVMMLMAHAGMPPPDPKQFRKDIPPALAAAVLKALEKEPAKRYANAEEMRNALSAAIGGAPAAVAAAAAAPAPAAPAPAAAAPPAPHAAPPAAPPPAPAPAPAKHAEADPDATGELDRSKIPVAPAPGKAAATGHGAGAAAHYSGKLPRAHKVVSYGEKKQRNWGRVIVILVVLAAIVTGIVWLLAPAIRGLSRSSRVVRQSSAQVARLTDSSIPARFFAAPRQG